MATPIITIDGSVSGAGTSGEARDDLDVGETVTFSDDEPTNAGASYVWTLRDSPVGSSASLAGETTATPTLVPDVTGSWLVECEVDGVDSAETIAAVPLPTTGARIPAFEETSQYNEAGNTKGWHAAMTVFMRQVDVLIGGMSSGALELIETQEVTGSAVSTITFSGLDGNVDDTYEYYLEWVRPLTGNDRIIMRPNNLDTNQNTAWTIGTAGSATGDAAARLVALPQSATFLDAVAQGVFVARASGSMIRKLAWQGGWGFGTASLSGYGAWADTTTNVTSLVFESVDAAFAPETNLGVGTRISLYKRTR